MQRHIVTATVTAFLDKLTAETPIRTPVSAKSLAEWKAAWADLFQPT